MTDHAIHAGNQLRDIALRLAASGAILATWHDDDDHTDGAMPSQAEANRAAHDDDDHTDGAMPSQAEANRAAHDMHCAVHDLERWMLEEAGQQALLNELRYGWINDMGLPE